MIEIYLAALALSVIHALIPNHWIPLVALARTEQWSRGRAAGATVMVGGAHVASTVLIGLAVGVLGVEVLPRLGAYYHWVAPAILLALGVTYLVTGKHGHTHGLEEAKTSDHGGHHDHPHPHPHDHGHEHGDHDHQKHNVMPPAPHASLGPLAALTVGMFFSPCAEVEAYYLRAGLMGWSGIAAVSIIYVIVTVAGMVALVDLGLSGANRFRGGALEKHERRIIGGILILLSVVAVYL